MMTKIKKRRSISVSEHIYLAIKAKSDADGVSCSRVVTDLAESFLDKQYLDAGQQNAQNIQDQRRRSANKGLAGHRDIIIDHPIDHTKPPEKPGIGEDEIKKRREDLTFVKPEDKLKQKNQKPDDDFFSGVNSF
jgi:hypothetical protein